MIVNLKKNKKNLNQMLHTNVWKMTAMMTMMVIMSILVTPNPNMIPVPIFLWVSWVSMTSPPMHIVMTETKTRTQTDWLI